MTAVIDLYRDEIARGTLRPDAAQECAVQILQDLYADVINGSSSRRKSGSTMASLVKKIPAFAGMTGKERAPQGIYLYGPVGRGKTHLMDLFFRALPEDTPKRRVHFHAFMLSVHEFLHARRQEGGTGGVDDALPKFAAHVAANARVLCFDEFHVVDVADAMILSRLFTALFDAGVRVVMTSNWAPRDLYRNGLQRELFLPFIDLINARLAVTRLAGEHDYRQARIAGRPVYFHPNGAAAQAALQQFFHDLTDGEDGVPATLDVLGHNVTLPRTAHGTAWAGFAHLCEKPLAAQDYLALAAAFHTLILDHVPRLTYDRRNETKRLMILVDILYEHHRRLVIAADAPLEKLFVDNEHAFEFTRTLSRLAEMQSAEYLAKVGEVQP